MIGYYYDIESLTNVFSLANIRDNDNVCELYYRVDDPQLIPPNFDEEVRRIVYLRNDNFDGEIELYNLDDPESVLRLAKTFGLSDSRQINNPKFRSSYPDSFRITCDTDPDYDEEQYPYFFGYNSYNYDTTMLTWYLYNSIDDKTCNVHQQTAASMRQFNDELFSPEFKERMPDRLRYPYKDQFRPSLGYGKADFNMPVNRIRKNMIMSGRHVDVAKLNEKQTKVGLKRILGMKGYQILESDKLRPGQDTIENSTQLLELLAYNVSDVANLRDLMKEKKNNVYLSGFLLKRQLLKDYPDLVYAEKGTTYKPDISQSTVRNDRLFIDSSSAQLATKALCPYGHLSDYDTVSFMYPSEAKAKALGIPRLNILDETKKFFYANFSQPELRARFDAIYNYYKSIEGKNFNSSKNYLMDHNVDIDTLDPELQLPEELRPRNISEFPIPTTCLPYFNADGSPSSCFVNFSIGGIHGAEYNKRLYEHDLRKYEDQCTAWQHEVDIFRKVQTLYPDPRDLKKAKNVVINGIKYTPSKFLKPKATVDVAFYKDPPAPPKKPELFEKKKTPSGKETWALVGRYTYTSAALSNHEDFTSYYPNLLRMMDAFYNPGLGYDRYGEIFDNKTKFGKLMKDKSIEEALRTMYSNQREGTKLVLNSASGAADAGFESNIRMNNKIISMRVIGQLFTYRIGQAQTVKGATMISTNTDGLYSVLEAEFNNKILADESASINVEIEPELTYLISKDSNNRMEMTIKDGQLGDVTDARGGDLGCRKGPLLTKSLAHPAILDWALSEYLSVASIGYKGLSLEAPFDDNIGRAIISSARKTFDDDVKTLIMFQNIIASSPGSQRFTFATRCDDPDYNAIPLQHYNRCYIMKDGTPNTYHLQSAVAKQITPVMQKKRKQNGDRPQRHDPIAASILAVNGVKTSSLPIDKEATVVKISNVEETWYMAIDNRNLRTLPQDEIDRILDSLDYEKYLSLLRSSYENNWRNATPEWEEKYAEEKKNKKGKEPAVLFTETVSAANADADIPVAAQLFPGETVTGNTQIEIVKTVSQTETILPAESPEDNLVPLDMSKIDVPKLVKLNKTLLSPVDISRGEHQLCMHGVREIDAHSVLAKVLLIMTNTDIDAP